MQETDRFTIDQMHMPSMVLMEKAAEAGIESVIVNNGVGFRSRLHKKIKLQLSHDNQSFKIGV